MSEKIATLTFSPHPNTRPAGRSNTNYYIDWHFSYESKHQSIILSPTWAWTMTVFSHSDIVDGAISKNRSPPYLLKVNLEKQSTSVSHTGLFGFFPQTLALNILFEKLILRCDNSNFHLLSSDSISFTFITKDSTVKLNIIFYSHIHSYTISPDVILCGWLGLKHQLTN